MRVDILVGLCAGSCCPKSSCPPGSFTNGVVEPGTIGHGRSFPGK